MTKLHFIPLFFAFGLSACVATTQDGATHSGFTRPNNDGEISEGLTQTSNGDIGAGTIIGGRIYGGDTVVGYQVGSDTGEGFAGYAGLTPQAQNEIGVAPTTGTVNYSGGYEMAYIDDISLSGSFISGSSTVVNGSMELEANFETGALSGESPNGLLSVDGVINGNEFTGTSEYRGTDGRLVGLIDGDAAIGAVHGNDANLIYAGGFYVEED